MKRRWKILLAAAGLLLLLTASILVTLHVQPDNDLEAYQKLLLARGEKLELAEVLPPPARAEENSADAARDAAAMFGSAADNYNAMRMVAPGKAAVCWQQADVRGPDFTNSWDTYRANIEADRPAVELLHQVLDRPKLDFQLDYSLGARMPMTHLATNKRAAQKLAAAAMLDLHDGDPGAAATNLLTMLALVQRDFRDDLLIGHLVRLAITGIAIPPTWEFLQATNLTDAQLAALQNGWQQLDFLRDSENTIATERAWVAAQVQKSRASHENFKEFLVFSVAMSGSSSGGGFGWPPDWETITERPRYAVAEVMWRSSWSYSQELQLLKIDQVILETVRTMETNRSQLYKADCDAMMTNLAKLGGTNARGGVFFRALEIPDFHEEFGDWISGTLRRTLQTETARRVVVSAIALKRFELKHGKLPETLAELAPEYLPSVPIDPYDGKPLKYHPNEDGTFLLYSVGDDGLDDGGDVTPAKWSSGGWPNWDWQHARDWVWPQPATPAEVQNFYKHPPK
jgi:hypothetical protein